MDVLGIVYLRAVLIEVHKVPSGFGVGSPQYTHSSQVGRELTSFSALKARPKTHNFAEL